MSKIQLTITYHTKNQDVQNHKEKRLMPNCEELDVTINCKDFNRPIIK